MKYLVLFLFAFTAMAQDAPQPNFATEFSKRWTATRKMPSV